MPSFNRVILLGNLTRDPDLRYTPSGTAVADVGLAVNERRKGQDGQWIEDVTFVDLTLFGRTAEVANEYLKKGSPALFEGRLKLDRWTDKNTGENRQRLKVIVERVQLLGTRGDAGAGGAGGSSGEPAGAHVGGGGPAGGDGSGYGYVDDPIPF